MRILICEDDLSFADQMFRWITAYFDTHAVEVKTVDSLQALDPHLNPAPHLLFQDILLPDGNALEAMAQWRNRIPATDLVYMTTYPTDVATVSNTRPFGFLDKTRSRQDLQGDLYAILDRWQAHRQSEKTFTYKVSGTTVSLLHRDIIYFEKTKRKVTPYTIHGEKPAFYATMKELKAKLDHPDFIMISQYILINRIYVESFRRDKISLRQGLELSISQKFRKTAQDQLSSYFKARTQGHDRLTNDY